MNDEQEIVQAVLDSYGLRERGTELSAASGITCTGWGAEDGRIYSLRLCAPAVQDSRSVEEELRWLEWVASRNQVRVPRPVRSRQGELSTAVATPGKAPGLPVRIGRPGSRHGRA